MPYEKVGKNEPVCIVDEVPFEIPESWEWIRLGSIGETNIGLTYMKIPHPSSCFSSPQQAFIREMGQRIASSAKNSTFFENGRNFLEQVGSETHGRN